jgi:fido (protein-threonine AMPylation protein)
VRSHAGNHRTAEYGDEFLFFGPNRSVHRAEVEGKLQLVFREVQASIASFDANPNAPSYEEAALKLAAWAHAQVIQIHPFQDGNGRAGRLFMNAILVRLGLRPIRLEIPRQEYMACLNHYFATGNIRPLENLCLRVYSVS